MQVLWFLQRSAHYNCGRGTALPYKSQGNKSIELLRKTVNDVKSGDNVEFAKRKSPRISDYNYSKPNYYFITICTENKKCIFGKAGNINQYGTIVKKCIEKISGIYPQIMVDKYVIMPNHIHMILVIHSVDNLVSITHIVGQFKMSVSKEIRKKNPDMKVWQRSFHDHIIRNERSYQKIWEYIENNPIKWEEDCFYNTDTWSLCFGRGIAPPLQSKR